MLKYFPTSTVNAHITREKSVILKVSKNQYLGTVTNHEYSLGLLFEK